MIWNKKELTSIKKKIINSSGLKLDENGMAVQNKYAGTLTIYNKFADEINELLNLESAYEISNVFNKVKNIKYDKENPEHIGLISSLSQIDLEDRTEIFTIMKLIIAQYERTISRVVDSNYTNIKDTEKIKKQIEKINRNEESEEEIQIQEAIKKIFYSANNIQESILFKNVINKYNTYLKKRITTHLVNKYNKLSKINESKENKDYNEYYMHKMYIRERIRRGKRS